ncbi:PREDICTED: uncharacterized protein LOC109361858 [Lupinus angustifolius]|uniref:uncharacterized protein LOC109361858 n=1 Tax=Lupinus angustifolius TaxID=3871 RepID=UPI00092FBDE3|nr:PREDICTED: uncharacterized protein LOC109361858 [Lupinus angustifolius]
MVAIVEEEGREEEAEFVYWCPPGTCLRNWHEESYASITLELKSDGDSETEGHASAPSPSPDQPVHQVEDDSDDDEWEASPELLRLMEQEGREIQPHQEPVELVNLGYEEDKKKVRVGTIMDGKERERLVRLLHEFKDVFAWSYEEMPGLDRKGEHVSNLKRLFERLRKYQLKLNPTKCSFGVKSGRVLGFIVSQKGIEVDPEKVKLIIKMPAPRTEIEVRGFLGRLNYISRFIFQLTSTCEPIFKLLRKNHAVKWNDDCQSAFEKIKQYLIEPPVLMPPVLGRPLILYLTVLDESMGCVLGQHDESGRKEHTIYYLSKKFTACEIKYSLLERTCCTLVWASRRLRQYMLSHTTWLISKMDSIKYIFEKPVLTGRIAKWKVLLSEYDIAFVTQKAIKGNVIADYLANEPFNKLGHSGRRETRDSKLVPYRDYILKLVNQFDQVDLYHIPREDNRLADALATLSSMFHVGGDSLLLFQIKDNTEPAYCNIVEEESDEKPWYHDIREYLRNQAYPPNASENDKRTLRRLATNFFLSGDVIYKRNHDIVFLRCLEAKEAQKMVEEMLEGTFGTHVNGHAMAKKIVRAGYLWLTMEIDCCNHVKKCHKCQIYVDNINAPPNTLNVLTSPWPFSMWGMDGIGPIEPKASNGHRFILVAIDYFTKWVEAISYASVTRKVVLKFITDNATNLNNKMMSVVEATNKNIKKIVQKMVVTYKDWHEMLPFALHGYRTLVRTSMGATPYSLVYGMEVVLPLEVEIPSLRVLAEAGLKDSE